MILDSTTTAAQATNVFWDVVVIGAGPAGAITAERLAQGGKRVLLLDAKTFPREKVCGGCINERALSALAAAGLQSMMDDVPALPIREYLISFRGRNLRMPAPGGLAVSRAAFDAALVRAALGSGAEFLGGTTGRLIPRVTPDHTPGDWGSLPYREVQIEQAGLPVAWLRGKVIVIADGVARKSLQLSAEFPVQTAVNSWVGLQTVYDAADDMHSAGQVRMLLGPGGYVGTVRIAGNIINLAAAVSPHALRQFGTPSAFISQIFRSAAMTIPPALEHTTWHGTGPLTARCRSVAGDRVVVVGDAAGYVEPFTGEGVGHALSAALELAELLLHTQDGWSPDLPSAWRARYRKSVAARQWICRGLALALHRPWATELAFQLATMCPALPQFLASRMNASLAGVAAL